MKPILVELSTLKPDHKNARKHSERNIKEIMRSLQANEQYRPFVVQEGTNRIIVGNGMYEAMKRLGIKTGWAEFRRLTEDEATKLAIADNRTAELAEWDFETLGTLFKEIDDDTNVPGWSPEEISGLLGNEESWEIEEVELKPYRKVHYLLSFDINIHDEVVRLISQLREVPGIEIESTLN